MPKSRQVSNALYTLHVPTHDPHGNPLQDLAQHGLQLLQQLKRSVHDMHVEGPHESHPYRHIKILAVDTPEVDTKVKSVGADLAQMTAHPSIFIQKQNKDGFQPWTVGNNAYTGEPANVELHLIPQATVAPTSYMNNP